MIGNAGDRRSDDRCGPGPRVLCVVEAKAQAIRNGGQRTDRKAVDLDGFEVQLVVSLARQAALAFFVVAIVEIEFINAGSAGRGDRKAGQCKRGRRQRA